MPGIDTVVYHALPRAPISSKEMQVDVVQMTPSSNSQA